MNTAQKSLFFALVLFVTSYLLTAPHYGVTWDSALGELFLGEKVWSFWKSGDWSVLEPTSPVILPEADLHLEASAAWPRAHPEHVWTLGPALASASGEIFFQRLRWLDPITARHVSLLLFSLVLFMAVFSFTRSAFNERAACFATLALMLYPRLVAELHNNLKDTPALVLFTLTLVTVFEGVKRCSAAYLLSAGVVWGLALSAKANALFLPAVVVPWLLLLPWNSAELPWSRRRFLFWASPSVFLGLLTYLITSPLLLVNFPLRLVAHGKYLLSIGSIGPASWQLLPSAQVLAVTPSLILLLALIGLPNLIPAASKSARALRAPLFVLFWLIVPILRVSVPRANDFDGIRHWMEFLPALAVLIGVGADRISRATRSWWGTTFALTCFAPAAVWCVLNHPHQLVFYNDLIGGLRGARERNFQQATDYWGSSYRLALMQLYASAPPNANLVVPVGGHIVAVSAPVLLRPDLRLQNLRWLEEQLQSGGTEPTFVMYVTRTERYPAALSALDRLGSWSEFKVDGETILKILRLPAPFDLPPQP